MVEKAQRDTMDADAASHGGLSLNAAGLDSGAPMVEVAVQPRRHLGREASHDEVRSL